jgi:8-oxo-dGTP pyrophosphatase MutT (NUDIX family)
MNTGNAAKYIAIVVLLSIGQPGAFAQPTCRKAFEEPDFAFAAGCLVKSGEKMLVVRHRYGGKIGFPGGFAHPGETAQCVAHRETWEESGVSVVVHGLLKRLNTGLALYRCEPVDGTRVAGDKLPVPPGGRNEITEVMWLDPHTTDASQWRFERDYPVILDLFDQWGEQ